MATKKIAWELTDHLCKYCGGRVLVSVANVGMTPGGNAIHRCADCGKSSTEMGGRGVCWCGFFHRGQSQTNTGYLCLPFSILETQPFLKDCFLACGCDPSRGDVGIVLEQSYREALKLAELNGGQTLKDADRVAADILFCFKGSITEHKLLLSKISGAITAARKGDL